MRLDSLLASPGFLGFTLRIPDTVSAGSIDTFIKRWEKSGGAERANYRSFLNELCDVFGVAHPLRRGKTLNDKDKVIVVVALLPETGPDPNARDRVFGRASKMRRSEIEHVLATLKALGQIYAGKNTALTTFSQT